MKTDISRLTRMKGKERLTVITCYDYSFARLLDGAVDIILVGDSLGNVVLGQGGTRSVTLADMARHTEAVARACKRSLLVADLPYGTYTDKKSAVTNAKMLVDKGAGAIKPEGSPEIVAALVASGIPVMGHVGLLPQTAQKMTVQGKNDKEADKITKEALAIERAGAFSLVIECVPRKLAKDLTTRLSIPTIGIGAGPDCDGQVLVLYDMLGLFEDFRPKFVKRYADLGPRIKSAVGRYAKDVKSGSFPSDEHSF
jgi:3-methyl-2-oxobutanoate hydroxymethyltransferase